MKITDINGVKSSSKLKKAKKTGDGGAFDAMLSGSDSVDESSAPASIGAIEAPSSLLSLQEVGSDSGSRQQSMQQGKNSLDILDELRRDMLLGEDNSYTLQRMREQQARLNNQIHDPQMQSVIDDIDLRLAVEIAKREASFV